jgi:hypothetical protein
MGFEPVLIDRPPLRQAWNEPSSPVCVVVPLALPLTVNRVVGATHRPCHCVRARVKTRLTRAGTLRVKEKVMPVGGAAALASPAGGRRGFPAVPASTIRDVAGVCCGIRRGAASSDGWPSTSVGCR